MEEARGILDCGCIINTDGSYTPCAYHNIHGFTQEEQEQLLLELASNVLGDVLDDC